MSRGWSLALVAAVSLSLAISPHAAAQCAGDLDGSGDVDVFDLLVLLSCWGPMMPACAAADLDGSGDVDVFDLLLLLSAWGPCGCAPNCAGVQCGDDGCGGSCGSCPAGQMCQEGACVEAKGACCYNSSPPCAFVTPMWCSQTGGSYQGDGTTCPAGPLPALMFCSSSCVTAPNCTNGQANSGCWCDVNCIMHDDCCPDACSYCDHCPSP